MPTSLAFYFCITIHFRLHGDICVHILKLQEHASFEQTTSHTIPNKEYGTDGATKTSYYLRKCPCEKKGAPDLVLTSLGNSLMGCTVHVPAAPTPATFTAANDTLS